MKDLGHVETVTTALASGRGDTLGVNLVGGKATGVRGVGDGGRVAGERRGQVEAQRGHKETRASSARQGCRPGWGRGFNIKRDD